MLSVENLTKSFGGHTLFENVSFKINPKERVGLVGRNGHGKTTLLRLITAQEHYDEGKIQIPKHYRIGYVRQILNFTKDSVLTEGMQGLRPDEEDQAWKVEKILLGLGFSMDDLTRPPSDFSGGFQVRLNLAKILVSEPDLLLLDEPTNYLDITSIRWIEQFLLKWPNELLLITHDRGFMDKVITHTVGIHRRKIKKITGNTEKYYAQLAQEEEVYEKTRLNDEKRKKEIELFITRFRAKARLANMVQSRIKTLSKMEKKEKLISMAELDFSFASQPFKGRRILTAQGLNFAYSPQTPLIRDFNITISPNDRVCIIGQNGKGKTTLLKLLAQSLSPASGTVTYNPGVEKGVFEQTHIKTLVDTHTVVEEVGFAHPTADQQKVRNICGAMMFEGDNALKKISVLSGGEKSRVMLAKLLIKPVNLILLDEPTNHLDMESCDTLLSAIDEFDGAVVMVTHNEMFLHVLAKRLVVFKDDRIDIFEGNYQDFLDKNGWDDANAKAPEPSSTLSRESLEDKPPQTPSLNKISKKELRKKRSEIIAERSKALKPLEKKIQSAENTIEETENKLTEYQEAMQQATQDGDADKIKTLSQSINACEQTIEEWFEKLDETTQIYEAKNRAFKEKLSILDLEGQET